MIVKRSFFAKMKIFSQGPLVEEAERPYSDLRFNEFKYEYTVWTQMLEWMWGGQKTAQRCPLLTTTHNSILFQNIQILWLTKNNTGNNKIDFIVYKYHHI